MKKISRKRSAGSTSYKGKVKLLKCTEFPFQTVTTTVQSAGQSSFSFSPRPDLCFVSQCGTLQVPGSLDTKLSPLYVKKYLFLNPICVIFWLGGPELKFGGLALSHHNFQRCLSDLKQNGTRDTEIAFSVLSALFCSIIPFDLPSKY